MLQRKFLPMALLRLALLIVLLLGGCAPAPPQSSIAPAPAGGDVPATGLDLPPFSPTILLGDSAPSKLSAVAARQARNAAALAQPPYILTMTNLPSALAAAQKLAVHEPRVQAASSTADGQRLRAEVMAVGAANAGDIPPAIAGVCLPIDCIRVLIYVYPTDTSVTVLVAGGAVRDVQLLVGAQPEIPSELAELAVVIARADPQLAAAFDGLTPDASMALMSAAKTALEGTHCERRRHLCVAPVFTWGEAALWTIVDLTDYSLVAATIWTEQGASGRRALSEAQLQDAALAPLCETPQTIEREGWRLSYGLTSSDGLELRAVAFEGRELLRSLKVVDWHVGYAGSDGRRVGFSDAIGCPVFSSAAVVPYAPPTIEPLPEGGFALTMLFRSPNWPQPCNYQYSFRASFGADGTLAALAGNEGRGCGVEGVYHPVLRIEPAPGTLRLHSGEPLAGEGMATWRPTGQAGLTLDDRAGSLSLRPIWGDAELAYVYWTEARPEEGQGDLPSIGSCCALDSAQGPEQFIGPGAPEPLTQPVIWFVPRIRNVERQRCWADTALVDGMLVPQVWPCSAGVVLNSRYPFDD
jgi:hypothetical protein